MDHMYTCTWEINLRFLGSLMEIGNYHYGVCKLVSKLRVMGKIGRIIRGQALSAWTVEPLLLAKSNYCSVLFMWWAVYIIGGSWSCRYSACDELSPIPNIGPYAITWPSEEENENELEIKSLHELYLFGVMEAKTEEYVYLWIFS